MKRPTKASAPGKMKGKRTARSRPRQGPKSKPNAKASQSIPYWKQSSYSRVNTQLANKFRQDIRGPYSSGMSLMSRVVNPTIPIVCAVDIQRFGAVALGIVSYALCRGWTLTAPDDNYPYFAWVYTVRFLAQAAMGGVPAIGNVPRFMNILCQAIIKKTVAFRGGSVSYNFDVQGTFDDGYAIPIGPQNSATIFNLGVKTASFVNGIIPVMTAPSTYTELEGEKAIQNLWLYLEKQGNPMTRMEPFNEKNSLTKDVSSFAFFDRVPGGGLWETGAWFKQLFCEVSPQRPLFSCFLPEDQHEIMIRRSKVKMRLFSGDGVMLGGMVAGVLKESQLSMKTPPVIKYVDFLEIVDVYARVLSKAINIRTQQAFFFTAMQGDPNYYNEHLVCPLTFQEFQLLLRATVVLVLTDNYYLQGTFPQNVTGTNTNAFVVYPFAVNTYPIYFGNMMFIPKILQENILALRSRMVTGGILGAKNPVIVASCLGQYYNDKLSVEDYNVTYTFSEATVTASIFTPPPSGEVPISLVDGHYVSGSTKYAAINDPSYLTELSAKFNKWIQDMGNVLRNVDSISTSPGVTALSVVHMTTHWIPAGSPAVRKRPAEEVVDYKDQKAQKKYREQRGFSQLSSVYSSRKTAAITSSFEVVDAVWTEFQQYFVTPINYAILNPQTESEATSYIRMAGYLREPYQLAVGSGSHSFSSLAVRHDNLANLMVKTPFAFESAQDKVLARLDEKGQGGILGELVSVLGASVGHAGVNLGAEMLRKIPI